MHPVTGWVNEDEMKGVLGLFYRSVILAHNTLNVTAVELMAKFDMDRKKACYQIIWLDAQYSPA